MWQLILTGLIFLVCPSWSVAEESEAAWLGGLKAKLYGDRSIVESQDIIELVAPYRAEDSALVPIQVNAKIPQTSGRYIKSITLVIDNNPTPFSAKFDLTPDSGKADLAMRMRVNSYTFVRAIAELNDGSLAMSKKFVKASGGCSAPIGTDLEAALQRMGKMKFKFEEGGVQAHTPALTQLLISHPNITGLQMDQLTRLIRPAHFVEEVKVSFNGNPVLTAKTDIAISADPNFRFYFVPEKSGQLTAEIRDNQGNSYSASQDVKL